jgi:hypothetical protein
MPTATVAELDPHRGGSPVTIQLNAYDRHPHLWVLALVGVAATAGLALFGLPPIDVHPLLHRLGVMDPMCGMTRGVQAVGRGQWRTAWAYNPASFVVVAVLVASVVRRLGGDFTGQWLDVRIRARGKVLLVSVVLLVLLEVNQQAHAALLMRS